MAEKTTAAAADFEQMMDRMLWTSLAIDLMRQGFSAEAMRKTLDRLIFEEPFEHIASDEAYRAEMQAAIVAWRRANCRTV